MTILVLGDQLAIGVGPLAERPDERVLMIESRGFGHRLPYHPHKLTLVFSAMRHFRDDLRGVGRPLDYREVESFGDGFEAHFEAHPGDRIVTAQPTAHGAEGRLREMIEGRGGTFETTENPFFLCPESAFDDWAVGRKLPYRHEHFYRFMRRETGYLMEGDEPRGGRWNFDEENRKPPGDERFPEPPRFPPDELTAEVAAWVDDEFDGGYGSHPYGGSWAEPEGFTWPVTRAQALEALDAFVGDRLAGFGPTQDAMLEADWSMNHAVLSPMMNVGLLRPAEVVEAAIDAAERDASIGLASLEGFVRQVIGWREFVRHAYRDTMPRLDGANQLDAGEDLPEFYWTGETDMACLSSVIDGVRRRGYSHHIQRLMVLANFALLYGVEPRQVNRWFQAAYVDAYHWVTTPNVIDMGLFGAGVIASKPYAASANYLDRMSDYCPGCPYDPGEVTGTDACPFNALYWEFLDRNEDRLGDHPRMGLVYSHLEGKDREALRERAAAIRRTPGNPS